MDEYEGGYYNDARKKVIRKKLWVVVNLFGACITFVGGVSPPLGKVGPSVTGF